MYPKLRELEKLMKPHLSSQRIIAVLGYLRQSKMIEVDLDGYITWVKRDTPRGIESGSLLDTAVMSEDFKKLLQNHMQYHTD